MKQMDSLIKNSVNKKSFIKGPKGSLTLKLANGVWRKRFPSRLAAGIFLANSIVPIAMAGPTGGTVVGGQGNINYGVNTTQINQNSNNLVIDWTSFDVNTNESVIFNQPTSQSIAVNNVLNNQASTISGSIQANGYVVLVNSSGVIFTESSTVDVGGLVVSGLAINTDAFLNGEFDFKAVENGDGFVVTSGVINAASGIVLLGESVENTGTLISAGVVNLTAADEVLLTFDEGGVIGLKVKEELLTNDLGVDAAVLNTGKIEAGSVVLDGRVSADLFARAVNNEGIIKAGGIDTSGGKIRLTGIGSDVINTGTLDASSLAHEGGSIHVEGNRAIVDGIIDVSSVEASGGQVRILGDAVGLVGNANINASGATGGGEVLVGGDYQGANPNIRNAEVTYIGSDTEINASAIESGDGGRVIVWANDTTRFYGDIKAEGGNEIGDGGFVETSGKRYVDLRGQVSARAENGTAGQWLIDPTNIEIVAFDDGRDPVPSTDDGMGSVVFTPGVTDSNSIVVASNITDALNGGSSVEITTNNSSNGPDNGDITVSTDLLVDPTNDVTLTLTADNNINVNADIQATGSNTGSLNVTLTAGLSEVNSGVVNLGSDSTTTSIVTRGGNVTVNAGSDDGMGGFTDGSVTLFAGSEIITEGGDNVVDINGEFVPVAGSVEIIASGDIGIIGTINTSGVVGDVGNAEARITGGVGQNAGDISLTSNTGDVNVTGSLMANGGAGGLGANGVIGNGSNRRPPTAGGVGGTGGNITLLGNNIFVDSTALISATGGSGGNGGDARDSNGAVDDGASGGVGGDGGVVDIQASGGLVVNVNIVAAGGRGGDGGNATVGAGSGAVAGASGNGGNGGAISIIASGELSISQELNTSFGTPGTPGDRDADVGNDDGVEVGVLGDFGSGGNIQISSDGVITLEDGSMVNTGGGTFTINSLNDTTNSLIAAGGINSVGGGVTFNIADTVELRGASNGGSFSLETGGGAFTINSNSSFTSSGSIVTESGNVNITAVGAVDIQGNINSSALVNNVNGGDVSITSGTSSITLGTELVPLDITSSAFGGSGSGGSITFNSRNSIVVRNSRITSRSDAVGTDSTPLASNNDINFNVTGDLVSSGLDIDSSVTLDSDIINASVGRGDDLMSTMDDIASVVAFGVILNERTGDLISIETSSLDDLVTVGGDLFSFSGATTTIDLGVGDDALDASSNDLNISAVGEVSLVSTGSGTVTLLGVEAFDNIGTLLGSDTDESFVLTGTTVTVDTVLDTSFTNVSVIDAGNGTDTVDINTDNASLGVSGFTTDSGVLVTNAETVNNTGTLTGSNGLDEAFTLTADQQVAVSGQTFTEVSSVQGNSGDADSIALSNLGVNLSGGVITSGTTSISTISTVTGVDAVVSDSGLTESFDLNGTTLAVNTQAGVSFEDVNTINGDASDSIALNNNNATLASITAFDTDSGVRVNTIGNVSGTGQLTGSALVTGGNSFTEIGSNQVSLLGFAFSGVNTVDGDTAGMVNVNNSGVALGASDFTSGNSITYTNVTTATQVGALTGTAGNDSFDETADNQINTNGFAFQGVSTVNGNGGTDSLSVRAGSSASLNTADFTVSGITYTNIDTVDGVTFVSDGVNGNRSYTLTNNDLDILGSTFNNITTLTAGTGTDALNINNQDLDLTVGLQVSGVTFSGIETVDNIGELTSAIGDTLTLSGTTLTSNAFAGVGFNTGAVIGDGSQTVNLTTQNVTLDTTRDFIAGGIGFDQIGTVTNVGTLTGTTAGESFTLSGTTATVGSVAGTSFQNVSTVDAGNGTDTVDINTDNASLGVSGFTTDSGVLVTNAETVNNTGTLTGSNGLDEAFTLTADQQVAVSGQTFTEVSSVQGNSGDADSIALSNLGVNLSGGVITSGTTSISTISTVTGVDAVVSDSGLTESFDLNGTTLAVNTQAGVSFEDVNTINGDASDSIALNNNNATLASITAFDTDSGVRVNTIGNVSGTGQLTGNASVTGGNSFTETGSNQVSLLGFAFSGVNTVDGDTAGMVNVNNSGVALGASDFTSGNSITYTNVTTATQVGTLTGTTGDDSFDETADNQIDTNGFAFQGVSTVNGNGGTDSLTVRAGSLASLNTADFTVSGITYTNIDTVDGVTSVSDGVNGNHSYTLTNNDLDILGSTFNNITTLTAGTGTDALNINNQDLDLTVGLQVSGVTFSGIETVDNIGELTSAIGDTLTLSGTTLTSNAFAGVGFNTGAVIGDGSQTVNLTTQNVTLDTTRDFIAGGIGFDQIGTVTNVGTLTGTTAGESFTLSGTTATVGSVAGTSFQNVSTVDAGNGTDTVDINTDNASLGVSGFTTDSGVLVTNAETVNNTGTLTGSNGLDEAFTLTADQQVAVSGQTFTEVSSVQGNSGDADSIALSNLGVNLSGGVITSGTTSISTISTVTGVDAVVSDSGLTESFDLNGTTLAVNTQAGVSFEDVNTINGDASDSIALNNNNATLASITAFDTDSGVRVNTIGNVSGTGQLTGSALVTGGNSFTEIGSNQVSLLGFAFSGVNTVDGDTAGMVNVNNSGVALGASDFTSGNSITYTNVTTATQVGALTGTAGNDSFDETADNQINTNGFAFQGVSTVNGNGGTDSLSVRAGSSASLNTADFTVSGITYTNIDTVDGVTFVSDGVNGNRSYTLTNNDLDILGSTFNNITTLTAGTGTDALNINNQDLDLTVGLQVSGVTFSGIETVDNIGELTSAIGDTLTLSGTTLTSNAFTGVGFNTGAVIGDGSQTLNLTTQNVTLDTTRDFIASGIGFDQIGTVTNVGTLTGTTAGDNFTLSGTTATVGSVVGTSFQNVNTINGSGGSDTVDISGQNIDLAVGLITNGVNLISLETINNIGALTAATNDVLAFNSSSISSSSQSGVVFNANNVLGDGSQTLNLDSSTVDLTSTRDFNVGTVAFEQIANVNNTGTVTATNGSENFVINGNSLVVDTVAGTTFNDVGNLLAGAGTDTVDINFGNATLTGTALNVGSSVLVTGIENVSNTGILAGSAGDNTFVETDANQVAVQSIQFSEVSSINGSGGNNSVNVINSGVTLGGSSFTSGNSITYTNVTTATQVGALTGSAGNDSFDETANNQIDTNGFAFQGVSTVNGNGGTDSLSVRAGSSASLNTADFTVSGITYTNIDTVDGVTFVSDGVNGNRSYSLTNNDLNILGSTFNNITTLTAGTGTDALNINNQDLDLTVGLQVSGVTFSGIETVDNIGELTSANSDTLTLSGTTLTSNAFAGVGFNTGVVIGDGSQTVNLDSQTVALTSNRDFNVGSIEFDQIGTVNNAGTLTGTSTGEIYTVSGSSVAVNTVSGTAFNNVSTVDGGLGQDTVDASGSDITLTASSFTNAAGLVFTSIENVENGSGNLIGTTGDDTFSETGSREVTSNGIIYGDITFVDGVSGSDTVDLANNSTVTLDSVNSLRFSGSSQINYDNVERVTNTRNLIGSSGDDNFTVVDRNNQGTTETVVRLDLLDGSGNTIDFIGVRDIDAGDTDINGDGIIDAGLDTINLLDGAIDGNRSTISELADGDISITGFERVNQSGGIALGSNGIDSFTVELNLDGSIDVVISLFDDTGTTVTSTTTILNASSIDGLGQTGSGDSILVGSGSTRSTLDPVLLETAGFRIFSTPGDLTSGLDVFNVEVVQNSGNVSSFASFDFAVTGASEGSASGVLFQDVGSVTGFTGSSLSLLSSALLGSASITSDLIEFTGFESISGASTIEVASGEQGQFSLVQGQMGALQTQLGGDSITFSGVSSVLNTGSLIGSSASDSFVLSGNNSLASAGISFEGVIGLDGGAGSDSISLSQAGAVLDARADVDFISSQISVFNVENITGTGVLTGSSLSESFSSVQSQQVSLGSISFNGVSRLIGSGGTDTLDINNASIALGSSVDAVDFTSRDIGVSGVEVVQRVTDITGSGEIEIFDITAADELSITTAANASLTVVGGGVVNAGASADDVVVNSLGDDIVLITGNSISVGGFTFTSIEQVQAAGTIVGTTLADQFEDFGNNEIGAFNIQFFGTNQVNGLGGADQFISNGSVLVFNGGTGNDALISDTNVELTNITNGADGVSGNTSFTGVEQFFGNETATFTGSDQNTLVGITGLNNGSLQVDGGSSVTFTGFGIIRTGSGTDTANFSASGALTSLDLGAGDDVINLTATSTASLIGGAGNDTLQLDNSNNIVDVTGVNSGDVNGNTFAGIENIITGSGADQVSVSGSLVNISTGAGNDSLQFTGSGSVSGLINAGTGSDSLVGGGAFQITNINANAVVIGELNGSAFEGVENFVAEGEATLAGSNQDLTFNLNSNGVLGVNLTGAGNQVFEVTGFSGLQAGSGFNNLITNGESSPFTITNGNSSFGGFAFSGIDFIEDNTGLVDISTPLAVSFSDTGLLNIGNNIQFDFNNAPLTISGAASVSGSLFAQSTISLMDITGDITLSGDFIDITATTIDGAVSIQDDNDIVITNISTAGGNVSVGAASGNIFLNTINTGSTSSGEVNLNASVSILIDPLIDFGENPDRIVNLTSASATLIANDIIGSENTPFRTNVFSFSSFSEEFVPVNNSLAGTIPRQSGFRISSIAERAATSGASVAAAQTGLEEIGNVDPAIFAELKPYAVGSSPLLLPEDQREDEFEENLDEEFVDYNESDTVSQK